VRRSLSTVVILAVLVAVGAVTYHLAGRRTAPNVPARVAAAALAPYRAFLQKEPARLCADFVPSASAYLARAHGGDCPSMLRGYMGTHSKVATLPPERRLGVQVAVHGRWASALLSYEDASMTPARGRIEVAMEEVGPRWLVATRPMVARVPGCLDQVPCPPGTATVIFTLGHPTTAHLATISVPTSGLSPGAKPRIVQAGEQIAVTAGCIACHRIGRTGNRGPGPPLTHIGARLNEAQLRRVLATPLGVMPSFRGLPKPKRESLLRFLALLQ
jgi:hypothetical protein